jgi:hypothetical protein
MPSGMKALKWICRLYFAEIDAEAIRPPRVYPQSNEQGWEITKIRIILHRNNAATL